MWSRNTKWQQGSVLFEKDFGSLKQLITDNCDLIIAVSHDCDIAFDNLIIEPNIEFIPAKILLLSGVNGNYTDAKNPRKLHLFLENEQVLELNANQKFSLPKRILTGVTPSSEIINEKNKKILQSWLAIRYKRHAFPNDLDTRLKPFIELLEKEGKKYPQGIVKYFVNYEPKNQELSPEEPYELWVQIVYASGIQGAELKANTFASKIKEGFVKIIQKGDYPGKLDLRSCEASADSEFTLCDINKHLEIHLEYISHRIES